VDIERFKQLSIKFKDEDFGRDDAEMFSDIADSAQVIIEDDFQDQGHFSL